MGDHASLRVGDAPLGGRDLASCVDDLALGAQHARFVVGAARKWMFRSIVVQASPALSVD